MATLRWILIFPILGFASAFSTPDCIEVGNAAELRQKLLEPGLRAHFCVTRTDGSSEPFTVSEDQDVTIECEGREPVNLRSPAGRPLIAPRGSLTFIGCEVMTVATREEATSAPDVPFFASDYFGEGSAGTIRMINSTMLVPSEFIRVYMGLYVNPFPDFVVAAHPGFFFDGTRVFASVACTSAAIAYNQAKYNMVPPGISGTTFLFENSTVWFSTQPREYLDSVIEAAEAARQAGEYLMFSYGGKANPNGTGPVSSLSGALPPILVPIRNGAPLVRRTDPTRDHGIPCTQRSYSSLTAWPPGIVLASLDGDTVLITEENKSISALESEDDIFLQAKESPDSSGSSDSGISGGVIAAIATAALLCIVALAAGVVIYRRRSKAKRAGHAKLRGDVFTGSAMTKGDGGELFLCNSPLFTGGAAKSGDAPGSCTASNTSDTLGALSARSSGARVDHPTVHTLLLCSLLNRLYDM